MTNAGDHKCARKTKLKGCRGGELCHVLEGVMILCFK